MKKTMFTDVVRYHPYPLVGQFATPGGFWVHAHSWGVRYTTAYREAAMVHLAAMRAAA